MVIMVYHQDLTYWANAVQGGSGGWTFDAPNTSYKCRWEERIEQIVDEAGNIYISNAQVFVEFIPKVGEYLYQGISAEADPTSVEGARQIQRVDSIPDLRNLRQTRKAYL